MATILFNEIVFGPIKSRRLGSSLGVNLLPRFGKWCSFDCIYCECGWNKDGKKDIVLPTLNEVYQALDCKLAYLFQEGISVDTITFSGNGEPTMHPNFPEIIDFTLKLRDEYFPSAKVSVLTNATRLGNVEVRKALMKVDNPILKIDSPLKWMVDAINIPNEVIKEEAEAILKNKEQVILVYCRSGRRSKEAANKLVELGYTNVLEFGGIIDWKYEIEK